MRLCLSLLGLSVTLLFPVHTQRVSPSGCGDVKGLAAALEKLAMRNWKTISDKRLQSMWPTELSDRDCNQGTCALMERDDRVINNACECCQLFLFIPDNGSNRLENIIIYYSTYQHDDIVRAAKKLAQALGVPAERASAIGLRNSVTGAWHLDGESQTMGSMEVDIVHRTTVWVAYVSVSRQELN